MTILAALGSVASSILMAAMNGYTNSAIGAQLQSDASIALDRIIRELRKVPRDSSASSNAPTISSVTASSIAFNTNYNLTRSGTTLNFVDNGAASRPLLQDVSSFAVQSYDESGTALATTLSGTACNAIRRIQITISLTRYGVSATVRTSLFIRPTMEGG